MISSAKWQTKVSLRCLGALCLLTMCLTVHAQNTPAPPADLEDARLAKPVRLLLDKATLQQITASLSAQTGLIIEPEACLKERVLTAQMEGLRARQALDALAEMNGWRLRQIGPSHYQIARLPLPATKTPVEVGQALPRVFPKDLQRFLGIDITPEARLPKPDSPLYPTTAFPKTPTESMNNYVWRSVPKWIDLTQEAFYNDLKPQLQKHSPLAVNSLPSHQKQRLVWLAVLDTLKGMGEYAATGRLTSYLQHMDKAVVEVNQHRTIMVMVHERGPNYIRSSGLQISPTPTPGLLVSPLERLNNMLQQNIQQKN